MNTIKCRELRLMLRSNLRILMAKHRIDDITELMEKSGLSRNSINKLYRETDLETVKLETLVRLCDTFQCKLSELIEYSPDE
ncbi:helix-turn-helix domain-containing protein [Paenibacillus sp. FSL M7-0420]|uniref:helix-turn-helix domain-containing protein n=1 Tax=Paenibacillus sp. FSL M7-0420 TaxID=2921609 RepID=UPI00404071B5